MHKLTWNFHPLFSKIPSSGFRIKSSAYWVHMRWRIWDLHVPIVVFRNKKHEKLCIVLTRLLYCAQLSTTINTTKWFLAMFLNHFHWRGSESECSSLIFAPSWPGVFAVTSVDGNNLNGKDEWTGLYWEISAAEKNVRAGGDRAQSEWTNKLTPNKSGAEHKCKQSKNYTISN